MLELDEVRQPIAIQRAKQVFRFLKAYAERNIPTKRRLSEQLWTLMLRDLPDHPSIILGQVADAATTAEGEEHGDTPLLVVRRPNLSAPPQPPDALRDWLLRGWESADGQIQVRPAIHPEQFDDDLARRRALQDWSAKWARWAEHEKPALAAMRVFERLYELHGRIERESEQVELLLGDGRLRWLTAEGPIDHPVLLQRVDLQFDARVPEFTIIDSDRAPELYGPVLVNGDSLAPEQFSALRVELETGGYHPLGRSGTSTYLQRLVQQLGARGSFHESATDDAGVDPVITRDAVLFLRTRNAGFAAAFERILAQLENGGDLPDSLTSLVGVQPPRPSEVIQDASSPWGEPADVLLSKPANLEQIQIARALERHNSVLVQGPPGTGKSHTIANLIGHLAAQGKRVLVTSHTTKALKVLRGQVVDTLQPLCVSVLENDLEGRKQMEEAVKGILSRLTVSSEESLAREADRLVEERARLNSEIGAITNDLAIAREAEYRPIELAHESVEPAAAARWIRDQQSGNDWIPDHVVAGAALPLSAAELQELYATNVQLSNEEEREISTGLPLPSDVPSPAEFAEQVDQTEAAEAGAFRALWERAPAEEDDRTVDQLAEIVDAIGSEVARMVAWQRHVVACGHAGGADVKLWQELAEQVEAGFQQWENAKPVLLHHEIKLAGEHETSATIDTLDQIIRHLQVNGRFGWFARVGKPAWKELIQAAQVNGRRPATVEHFHAIRIFVQLEETRARLAIRWQRQAVPAGLPDFTSLASPPEPRLREFSSQFPELLEWWRSKWSEFEHAAGAAGLKWRELRKRQVADGRGLLPFDRDIDLLGRPVQDVIEVRAAVIQRAISERALDELEQSLTRYACRVAAQLRAAARTRDVEAFEQAWNVLVDLTEKTRSYERRNELLARLNEAAPGWANAIRNRWSPHDDQTIPGDPTAAWKFRQLHQEITRRAALDERELTRTLTHKREALRNTTARLIDTLAWSEQLKRTDLNAKQALQGWADTQKKIGKGTGKRAPELQAEARRLLAKARDAVPVWIMPLSRVAESFDPTTRFDVVIIDEASQSDVTGLLAWYLGRQVVVVGDHEQVSPMGVGQQIATIGALTAQHLQEIPNKHLYDGATSIYDLARQSFGGTIALREHFRCVPDIIEFCNDLCYDFQIHPLRDPSRVPGPHVIEYVVPPALGIDRSGKTNKAEARIVAALIKAVIGAPEYDGKTLGAITLLGDEQADLIQELAVSLVGAVDLEARRFVAGNSAQFQGDERDVVMLSMVDVPSSGQLNMRQTESLKQRYNVAVSRARDQLWLVHSLDPNRHLKPGDLRRRLIEYVRNPFTGRRILELANQRAESPLERALAERLKVAGYRVKPRVSVGRYRIDMVVTDGEKQVAIECDGDRYHRLDQIPEDMTRQAVLERAGWTFIRVRGTRFYRDPEATMAWVLTELSRLGIEPVGLAPAPAAVESTARGFRDRIVLRTWEIMVEQGWTEAREAG